MLFRSHVEDFDCNKLSSDPSTGKEIVGVLPKLIAAENVGVKQLLVSDSQKSDLPLPKGKWIPCATFSEIYNEASEIEGVVKKIVERASSFWSNV